RGLRIPTPSTLSVDQSRSLRASVRHTEATSDRALAHAGLTDLRALPCVANLTHYVRRTSSTCGQTEDDGGGFACDQRPKITAETHPTALAAGVAANPEPVASAIPLTYFSNDAYLTTFRCLLDSSGPQDAEPNLASQLAFGLDEADYVLMDLEPAR
ncbi:MAG: hypothetical protein NTY19_44315, partial [Planctomycetota bacterium]|nr:hypothetical protein [Planctomycetota bacterium]